MRRETQRKRLVRALQLVQSGAKVADAARRYRLTRQRLYQALKVCQSAGLS